MYYKTKSFGLSVWDRIGQSLLLVILNQIKGNYNPSIKPAQTPTHTHAPTPTPSNTVILYRNRTRDYTQFRVNAYKCVCHIDLYNMYNVTLTVCNLFIVDWLVRHQHNHETTAKYNNNQYHIRHKDIHFFKKLSMIICNKNLKITKHT